MPEEGLVHEILSKGSLSTEEIKKELEEKDICFVRSYDRTLSMLFFVLAALWLLPAIARWTGWGFLRFFAELPRVDFPVGVVFGAAVLFAAAVALEAVLVSARQKQGGCRDAHETVVLVRDGPYGVIRHPGYLAEMVYFSTLPVVVSKWVPFTVLAALCLVVAVALIVYLVRVEDRFNLRKWGQEYRRYMAEVPAVNFVKGLRRAIGGSVVPNTHHRDYYVAQSAKILRDVEGVFRLLQTPLAERYGPEMARTIHRETLVECERLLPEIPYVGGKENPLTTNLVRATEALALYRVLLRHGGTVEEAGELIHHGTEAMYRRIPAPLRRALGQLQFTRWQVRKKQRAALRSQERRYPGDWVWEVIEGDGQAFDLGMDFVECAIVKFLHSQGAEEFVPYLCNIDYVTLGSVGIRLERTKTLAWGCDRCDFRFFKSGDIPPAWPPRFVERHCGKPADE